MTLEAIKQEIRDLLTEQIREREMALLRAPVEFHEQQLRQDVRELRTALGVPWTILPPRK